MSQFSTALEGGSPTAAIARASAPQIRQTGITESANAPGLEVVPPASSGVTLAAQLGEALGSIGSASDHLMAYENRKRIEADRQAAMLEHDRQQAQAQANQIATLQKGDGKLTAQTALPDIKTQIANGLIKRMPVSAADQASQYVDELTKGASQDWATGYREHIQPQIAAAFAELDQKAIDGQRDIMLNQAATVAVNAQDATELQNAYNAASAIGGVTAEKAASSTYLAALQSAAELGNPDRFNMVRAAMPAGLFGIESQRAEATLRERVSQAQARIGSEADNIVSGYLADVVAGKPGASLTNANNVINQYEGKIDGQMMLKLRDRVKAAETQMLSQSQEYNANALKRDVTLGAFPTDPATKQPSPVLAINDIAQRMSLNEKDPLFLKADHGSALINQIKAMFKTDLSAAKVSAFLQDAPRGAGVFAKAPLTSADDEGMMKHYGSVGLVSIMQDGEKIKFMGVQNPIALAQASRIAQRVPEDIVKSVAAGLGSANQQQVQEAATTLGALANYTPELVDGMDFNSPIARARARFIADRIKREGSAPMLDNKTLADRVTPIVQQAMQLDPAKADYQPDQALGIAMFTDPNARETLKSNFMPNALKQAGDEVKAAFKNGDFWKQQGAWSTFAPRWAGGVAIDNVPTNVASDYLKAVEQEFVTARMMGMSEADATTQAKKIAAQRTLTDNPPILWNDRMYFTGARGQTFNPNLDQIIGEKVKNPEMLKTLRSDYVPYVDPQQGNKVVFLNRLNPAEKFITWSNNNVGPLVIDLNPPSQAEIDMAKEAAKGIAASRARKAPVPPKPMPGTTPVAIPGRNPDSTAANNYFPQ